MCAECYQIPCHPLCPNAPEEKPVDSCVLCSEDIFEGDEYFESADGIVCEDCINDMSAVDILELCGESMKIMKGA